MSYYALEVTGIPIGVGKPHYSPGENGQEFVAPVHVEECPPEKWLEVWEAYGEDENDFCTLEINDNGVGGDGLWLQIYLHGGRHLLLSTQVPSDSIGTLISALQAVQRLRESQADDKS